MLHVLHTLPAWQKEVGVPAWSYKWSRGKELEHNPLQTHKITAHMRTHAHTQAHPGEFLAGHCAASKFLPWPGEHDAVTHLVQLHAAATLSCSGFTAIHYHLPTHTSSTHHKHPLSFDFLTVHLSPAFPFAPFLTPTQAEKHSELPSCLIKWRYFKVYVGVFGEHRRILDPQVWAECYHSAHWHENHSNGGYYTSLISHDRLCGWRARSVSVLVMLIF